MSVLMVSAQLSSSPKAGVPVKAAAKRKPVPIHFTMAQPSPLVTPIQREIIRSFFVHPYNPAQKAAMKKQAPGMGPARKKTKES